MAVRRVEEFFVSRDYSGSRLSATSAVFAGGADVARGARIGFYDREGSARGPCLPFSSDLGSGDSVYRDFCDDDAGPGLASGPCPGFRASDARSFLLGQRRAFERAG